MTCRCDAGVVASVSDICLFICMNKHRSNERSDKIKLVIQMRYISKSVWCGESAFFTLFIEIYTGVQQLQLNKYSMVTINIQELLDQGSSGKLQLYSNRE